jgi:hypothetical protein
MFADISLLHFLLLEARQLSGRCLERAEILMCEGRVQLFWSQVVGTDWDYAEPKEALSNKFDQAR